MAGGIAVILGEVGRNFGAGMSGGVAYVLDEYDSFEKKVNGSDLNILPILEDEDENEIKTLLKNHLKRTNSKVALRLLNDWDNSVKKFKKVLPEEYRQALERLKEEELQTA